MSLKQEQVSVDMNMTEYVFAQEKPKMFAKGTEITHAVVIKKLNEILQARGKKGTDRATQIELLQLLVQIASENNLGEGVIVKIKFNIIASLYDYNPNLATYMKVRTTEEYHS